MRLISTLKRAKYIGAAMVLLLAAMPVSPIATWIAGSNKASAAGMPTSCEGLSSCTEVTSASEILALFTEQSANQYYNSNELNIILTGNVDFGSVSDPYFHGVKINLYLGDYTMEMGGTSLWFEDDSILNIYGGSGSIHNAASWAPLYFYSGTDVTLYSGNIVNDGVGSVNNRVKAVEVKDEGSSFTMEGGTVSSDYFGIQLFDNAQFVMNGGAINAEVTGVSGNGTIDQSNPNYGEYAIVTINDGVINAGELGIYAPHAGGVTNINGGTINSGSTGVELRAGTLNISGGTITASSSASYSVTPNGNGSTTEGAAIAVSQHMTRQPITLNITGGTFTGPVAFSQRDPQDGDPVNETTSITGGTFTSTSVSFHSVETEDTTKNLVNVSGGTFSDSEVALDKLAEGKTVYKISDTEYVVDTAPSYELPARIMMKSGTYTFDGMKDDAIVQKYGIVEAHYHNDSEPAPVLDKTTGTLTYEREIYGAASLKYDIYEPVNGVVKPTEKYNQKVLIDAYSVKELETQYVKMGKPIANLVINSKMSRYGNNEFTSMVVSAEDESVATISKNEDGTYTLTGVKTGNTKIFATITDTDETIEPQVVELGTAYVWDLKTKKFEEKYDLGNLVTTSAAFKVWDEGGTITTAVKDADGNPATDVVVKYNEEKNVYKLKLAKNARPGVYTVEFIDTIGGEKEEKLSTKVYVHSIEITGSSEHYIVTTRDPFHQDENRLNLNVVEKNGFMPNRDITAEVNGFPVDGLTTSYRHQGNWHLTGNEAGSYTVTFSDGYASADYKVYVMKFTFGQDSYHVRLKDDEPYIAVNAFNQYWHDVNVAEHRWDTYFKIVRDEDGTDVTGGYISMKVEPSVSEQGEDYRFYWCNGDDNCLSAGNYTVHYSADANGGDVTAGGKTATKNIRLHIYNMVAPDYGTRYTTVDKTIDVDVYDENERGSVTATIEAISGDADGLSFATSGFGPWTTTDYTRLEANKPGVYMVHYTDRMANGEIVDTYDLRVVVIEVEEQTLLVAEGETIDITGNADWSASFAVDDTTGDEYTADESGTIKFDTTGMELGRHEVSVAHDFEEYEEEGYPVARETVKKVNVVVYKISSDPVSDPKEVTGDTIKELLDTLNEEGLADDLLESNFWRLWNMTSREDIQALFGPSRSEAFETLMNLRNAIIEGQEVSTFVDVHELTEDEVETMVDEQLKDLVKIMDSEGNVTYYDVNIFLMVNEDIVGLLHQLNNPITVCLGEVEGPADGYSRQFTVLRQHAGEAPEIMVEGLKADGGFFIENGKLYIVSSKFSQYAVFYEDTLNPIPAPKAPETGDTMKSSFGVASVNLSVAVVAVMATVTLAGAAVVAKRK